MSNQNKLYMGLGITLLYIALVSILCAPFIATLPDGYFPLVLLGVILFILSCGILLAYTWKGIDLKKQNNRRWIILFLIPALYIALYAARFQIPQLLLMAPGPIVLPFLGFWFARRFFEW